MRLTVVGCAGSFPSAASPASCYLVEHDGAALVLDLGNGSLGALQQFLDLDDPGSLTAVALSHCHIDHCADAGSLYVMRTHHPTVAFDPLPVFGPSDTAPRLSSIYGMSDPGLLAKAFEIQIYASTPTVIGPFTIDVVSAAHPVESYSLRITADDRSITYSGDTGPQAALVSLAAGTDIALFEASNAGRGHPPNLHMSGAEAGRAADAADAGLLVLTHLVAWNDDRAVLAEAVAEFDGPIELARPGMTISLE